MRRAIILTAALLLCAVATAQTGDAALLRRAHFGTPAAEAADSLQAEGRVAAAIGLQLAGKCPFDPDNSAFFRQAVREAGFFPAIIFTADRLTRSGRVGTAQHHHFSEDGLIHEGVEAYLPGKRKER